MRKFHSIAALCGDGLRPELQALFDRLAIDPRSEVFVRDDGMVQAGPDPASETVLIKMVPLIKKLPESELVSSSAEVRFGSKLRNTQHEEIYSALPPKNGHWTPYFGQPSIELRRSNVMEYSVRATIAR